MYKRQGSKSDLLSCFTTLYPDNVPDVSTVVVDTYVLDGAVIVQMSSLGCCKTFSDYRDKVFIPFVLSHLKKAKRVDVVFDVYHTASLKTACREKRGTGIRTRVLSDTKIPSNWQQFLHVDENKQELFSFLAEGSFKATEGEVVVTRGDQANCLAGDVEISSISPCNHEEADTRMLLHCWHASQCGSKKLAIRTVDTDVVVLAIFCYQQLNVNELWIHFGVGKNVRLLPVHAISKTLGPKMCQAMPIFHALTGCDTVSSFFGKGKRSAWEAWKSYPAVTDAFNNLYSATEHSGIDPSTVRVLERFIVVMYDRTSECTDLDAARKFLFTKKTKSLDSLPPTSAAFVQHLKRAVYQAVLCWSNSLKRNVESHDPSHWGWSKDGSRWVPFWSTLPEVSECSRELIHCWCKKGCTGRCKCVRANLVCTALCHCDGECNRN